MAAVFLEKFDTSIKEMSCIKQRNNRQIEATLPIISFSILTSTPHYTFFAKYTYDQKLKQGKRGNRKRLFLFLMNFCAQSKVIGNDFLRIKNKEKLAISR